MNLWRQFLVLLIVSIQTSSTYAQDINVKVIALFTDKAVLSIDGKQKMLAKGDTFNGVTLLSASGRGAVVSVDGEQQKVGLNQSIQGNFKSAERVKSRIYSDPSGMYYVDGRINGYPAEFLVDTGATFVSMSSKHAEAFGIDFRKGRRSSAQTATETVPVWQVYLKTITVGNIKLSNIEASVIDGSEPGTVLLGNSFLRRTELQRIGNVMELRKRF